MEKKTVIFNSQDPNGPHTTVKGVIEMIKYASGGTDLFVRGPKGGMRHLVVLPDSEALLLGQELTALYGEAKDRLIKAAPELLKCLTLALKWLENLKDQGCNLIDAQPYEDKAGLEWFRRAIAKAQV